MFFHNQCGRFTAALLFQINLQNSRTTTLNGKSCHSAKCLMSVMELEKPNILLRTRYILQWGISKIALASVKAHWKTGFDFPHPKFAICLVSCNKIGACHASPSLRQFHRNLGRFQRMAARVQPFHNCARHFVHLTMRHGHFAARNGFQLRVHQLALCVCGPNQRNLFVISIGSISHVMRIKKCAQPTVNSSTLNGASMLGIME